MAPQMEYITKTQHYLKVQKPLLERQRRARMNKCLDSLKQLVAEFQGNDSILRMDKAEMLETALVFIKKETKKTEIITSVPVVPMDSFRHGYMNAVNEVSRIMAATPDMNVCVGKAVMRHLGSEYNRLLHIQSPISEEPINSAPMSPASSGYHSDECEESSPMPSPSPKAAAPWRPW